MVNKLFTLCLVSLILTIPSFAQSHKQQTKKPTTALQAAEQPQPKRVDVTVDDLEQKAYRRWLTYYRRIQQGEQLPLPTFTIPSDVPPTEAKQARQLWQKAQRQAQLDFRQIQAGTIKLLNKKADIAADSYQVWLKWYQDQQQGIRTAPPSFTVSHVDAQEARQANALWEQGRIRAEREVKAQIAKNNQPPQAKNVTTNTPTLSSLTTSGTPITRGFQGMEYDPDLGLYYARSRWYNPETGRFITQDTFESSRYDTSNRHKYIFASNNPVNIIDPTGKFGIGESGGINSFRNTLNTFSTINFGRTVAAIQNASQLETLKLNIVYETISQNGSRISYSDSEKQDIRNSFGYFAGFGFGNIDIKFNITETDGDATNLYNPMRMVNQGYVSGSLNAFFTKRGDPSPSPAVTVNNGSFINSKSDVKNLLHELIHQIGVRTGLHGYSFSGAESESIRVERALLSGRQDYNLPPLQNNIFYNLRLWGADYAAPPVNPVK